MNKLKKMFKTMVNLDWKIPYKQERMEKDEFGH